MEMDWNIVADRKPQGYIEFNNGKETLYGPIESVTVSDIDFVELKLKWAIKRPLGEMGIPTGNGTWEVVSSVPVTILEFPNLVVPFQIEDTPEKGPRVRFGGLHILYFNNIEKVDPSKVEGLQLVTT